jgi:gliding motility-associated-like protein
VALKIREQFVHMPINRLITFFVFALCCLQTLSAKNEFTPPDSSITINFLCQDAEPGETICIGVEVENFVDVQVLFLSFNFDPTVLRFIGVQNEVLSMGLASNPGPAEARYIWIEPSLLSVDLPDGTVLLELCFEIVGIPGSTGEIDLTENFPQEISNPAGDILPIISNSCVVNVLNPNAVSALITTCGSPDGIQDGEFTITIFGGTGPYSYTWTGPVNGASSITNSGDSDTQTVPIGTYAIVVTDNIGGTFMLSVTIMDLAFVYSVSPFDPTCYNFTNGRIAIDAANGSPPYGIIWENTTNSQYNGSAFILSSGGSTNLNSLPSGTYNITITDDDGCSAFDTVMLDVDEYVFDNIVLTDATCNGSGDGGVSIEISGGTPIMPGNVYELTFSWMAGVSTANQFTDGTLNPGSYAITISDAVSQCDTVFEFTIGTQLMISADIAILNPSCPGGSDGEALITGIPAGSYVFQKLDSLGNPDGAPTLPSASTRFMGLDAGVYGVLISDGSCASDTLWFILADPDPMTIMVLNIVPQGCQFMDGTIAVQALGGEVTPPSDYVYSWNGGALMGSTISNLSLGNYMLVVSDDNGCTIDTNIVVPRATDPEVDSIVATNLSCTGEPITTVEVFFTEGTFPVTTVLWSNGETSSVITNQSAGDTLFVTIRDDKFCFDISSNFIVPGGSQFTIDSVRLESPTCPGDDDGQFTVFTSGGIEPLTYIWSTGDTTTFNLLAGLTAGAYSVTVVDASDSCGIVSIDVNLEDIESLEFFFSNIDSTGCSLNCTGQATLIPSGGEIGLPYNFFWASGLMETAAQSTATGLCGGWEKVSISQDNLCFFTDSVFIPFPSGILIEIVAINDIVCSGADDGFISLSASGGGGSYQYTWDNLPQGPVQNNLGAGTYYVTVTDIDMCAARDSFTIVQGDSVFMFLDTTTSKPIGCSNGNNGAIGLQTIGGTPGYDYTWFPDVSNGPLAQMLGPGTYEITVTDQIGCTDTISVTLTEPEPIQSYLAEVIPPKCAGDKTTISIDSVIGGNGDYTWSINGGQKYTLDDTVAVSVGFYSIIVSDESNCRDTTMIVIAGPPPIELEIFPADAIVKLGDSIQLLLVIDSTQGPVDSIAWGHDETGNLLSCYDCTTPFASNVLPTTYFVQVWDSAGCLALKKIFVDVDNKRNVYIPNVFSPNQDGRNEDFKIFTGQGVRAIRSARVFNRWGELMVEINNPLLDTDGTFIWNGEFRGQLMEPGVYVYMAEILFEDAPDKPLIYRGDLTLLR